MRRSTIAFLYTKSTFSFPFPYLTNKKSPFKCMKSDCVLGDKLRIGMQMITRRSIQITFEAECGGIFDLKREKNKTLNSHTTSAASVCECDEVYKKTPSLLPPSHRLILRLWPHLRMQWTQWWLTSSSYLFPFSNKSPLF